MIGHSIPSGTTAPTSPLLSVMPGLSSAQAIERLRALLYPDARTALDLTYGRGGFWAPGSPLRVVGLDRNPARARDVCADFTALPFLDDAFDLAIFDPPFLTEMSPRAKMGAAFGWFASGAECEAAVRAGCREAGRVGRLGAIVKVQDHIHSSKAVWMSEWVRQELGEPFDFLMTTRASKMGGSNWGEQLSVRRNHCSYWCFRFDGQRHQRRRIGAPHGE